MKTRFTINTAKELPDGSVMVSGSIEGQFLKKMGQHGYGATEDEPIEVAVIGIGVINPNFLTKERQGILIKVVKGNACSLVGLTLDFEGQEPSEGDEAPNLGK